MFPGLHPPETFKQLVETYRAFRVPEPNGLQSLVFFYKHTVVEFFSLLFSPFKVKPTPSLYLHVTPECDLCPNMKPSKKRRISGLHRGGCSECATWFVPFLWFCILPLELTLKQNNALCAENQVCKAQPSPLGICLHVKLDSSFHGNTMQSLQI